MKSPSSKSRKALVVAYNYLLNDPPARQAAGSLAKAGYETTVLQSPSYATFPTPPPPGVRAVEYKCPEKGGGVKSLIRWLDFQKALAQETRFFGPGDVVVTFMLHSLAALFQKNRKFRHVACIYDIPPMGRKSGLDPLRRMVGLDPWIFKRGWSRLKQADLVWSSDRLKGEIAQGLSGLPQPPLVCHNCPPENYIQERVWPRDPWLRKQLIKEGAPLSARSGGSILLRAGAVGDFGGLEETLEAMTRLPKDYVYLMLGRPYPEFLGRIKARIEKLGLRKRAFIWEKASDETWKKALLGADIGQMIHLPPEDKNANEIYRLNSGLSYNRTFLYMAAGIPVLSFDDPRLAPLYRETGCFRAVRLSNLAEDIEKIWRELGRSKALRQKMGRRGREMHLKRYSWEKQFAPLLKTIKSWS